MKRLALLVLVIACDGGAASPLDQHVPGVPPGSPAIAPPNDPPAPPDATPVVVDADPARYQTAPSIDSATGAQSGWSSRPGRTASAPAVSLQTPTAKGQLDKAIIRRYIKRNINKIQYCYERELLTHAGLAGVVTTQFTIEPDGTVGAAQASGVEAALATCITNVIKTIEFPKPKDGNPVAVTYPFTFRPAVAD